jgi:N-methylhydantoinase A/oxoprolinase/acetone carboxylase beta subunit
MRIGIDVGGTNTDAVVMDGRSVVGAVKAPTTSDVTSGIVSALGQVLSANPVDRNEIQAIMIGTTHFTNALAEGRRLAMTATIRLASVPQTLMPMVDWPDRLREAIGDAVYVCPGGHEYDGSPIVPFDDAELRRIGNDIAAKGLTSIALSSVFSPIEPTVEEHAKEILAEAIPGADITMSHEIGTIGLLERENATILNASLRPLADGLVDGLVEAVRELDLDAPIFLSQNDGTLMSVEYAKRFPVATLASGPTNSMRGAAFLSGIDDCAVVDVGGTTSDIGILRHGFPRQASVAIRLAGVRTNFRMPDVLSLAIGGGSLIRENGKVTVGPDSVGYELTDKALVFGGTTLTATDVAVRGGLADIGDRGRVAAISRETVDAALEWIREQVNDAIDRMRPDAQPIPIVLVGGGSVLLNGSTLSGVDLLTPENHAVANAIGAAIAQVGGEVDRIYSLTQLTRQQALADATREATERAIAAGAMPDSVIIVDQEDVQLSHLPGGVATRIRVKAVGDLQLSGAKGDRNATA